MSAAGPIGWSGRRRLAHLRRDVRVSPDRLAELGRVLRIAGEAQVDQARRDVHDDVARLDVEVDDPFLRQVVEQGGDVHADGQELLHRQPAVLDQTAQGRAVEILEQEVRMRPVGDDAESADEEGMGQSLEQAGLSLKRVERALVLDAVRTQAPSRRRR